MNLVIGDTEKSRWTIHKVDGRFGIYGPGITYATSHDVGINGPVYVEERDGFVYLHRYMVGVLYGGTLLS